MIPPGPHRSRSEVPKAKNDLFRHPVEGWRKQPTLDKIVNSRAQGQAVHGTRFSRLEWDLEEVESDPRENSDGIERELRHWPWPAARSLGSTRKLFINLLPFPGYSTYLYRLHYLFRRWIKHEREGKVVNRRPVERFDTRNVAAVTCVAYFLRRMEVGRHCETGPLRQRSVK